MRIVVIGAGVIGLSSAIRLLQAGYEHVTVIAKHKTPHTTSDGAGALWRPQIEHLDQQTATFGKWGLEVTAQLTARQQAGCCCCCCCCHDTHLRLCLRAAISRCQ
jgi:D-amino-acid oxidase